MIATTIVASVLERLRHPFVNRKAELRNTTDRGFAVSYEENCAHHSHLIRQSCHGENSDPPAVIERLPKFMRNEKDMLDLLVKTEDLWRGYNDRMYVLELQKATHGINADPAVVLEIRQIKVRLEELKKEYDELLEGLEYITKGLCEKTPIGKRPTEI